jgi:hypothetical protein
MVVIRYKLTAAGAGFLSVNVKAGSSDGLFPVICLGVGAAQQFPQAAIRQTVVALYC